MWNMSPRTLAKGKVFVARTIYLVMGFAEQRSFGELLPGYVKIFHTSVTLAGWSLTLITGLSYLLAPVIRILIDMTSLRFVALVGGTVYGMSFIILGLFAKNIWHVFVLHTLIGLSSASVNLATYIAIGEQFETSFGVANSASYLIASIIGITFPLLVLYFNVTYGLRWTLMLYGAISLHLIAGGLWVTSRKTAQFNITSDGVSSTNHSSQPSLVRAHPTVVLLFLFYGVTFTISVGYSLVLYPFGLEKDLPLEKAALLISWYSIGSVFGRLYIFLVFKWQLEYRKDVIVVPITIEVALQLASIYSSNAVVISLGAAVAGFATGTSFTWASSVIREISCEMHFRSAVAWLTTFAGVGATFAGLFAGWIHGINQSYQYVVMSYVGLSIIQCLLALAILVLKQDKECHVSPSATENSCSMNDLQAGTSKKR
ncbi:uncharacterized protein [Apostichopus japonicus]|uniref:uncharacterized protein isoform X1 n=2 Tax=Stichopus japonicus TaxID=307972 RepID=UPI003AB7C9C6